MVFEVHSDGKDMHHQANCESLVACSSVFGWVDKVSTGNRSAVASLDA